ncbi:MAG: glutathione S-transferase [Synechococcales cyanobacterium T60_A2020_003]|nr:glutathione S-transferase [Synechococcales cyanobacterium T60_A2020_003]
MLGISTCSILTLTHAAAALPPPEDTPEEVLRTEIILEARSPLDGEPLTAAEYAELQDYLSRYPEPEIAPEIRQLIRLLYLRRAIRSVFPFLLR